MTDKSHPSERVWLVVRCLCKLLFDEGDALVGVSQKEAFVGIVTEIEAPCTTICPHYVTWEWLCTLYLASCHLGFLGPVPSIQLRNVLSDLFRRLEGFDQLGLAVVQGVLPGFHSTEDH